MKQNYQKTLAACFTGNLVQAIVNNFAPLLFLTFQKSYAVPLSQITLLVTFNFGVQLLVDLLSAGFVDRLGYRRSAFLAHLLAAAGLLSLAILPGCFADPFVGLLIAVSLYAAGGGLLEVLVSPIVESCPTDNKETAMSLLHSFYCWGQVGVVLLSTAFFAVFGIENWRYLSVVWALFSLANGLFFLTVPIAPLVEEGQAGIPLKALFQNRLFWVFLLLMLCAGASEQAVSQWASAFAERGLGVSKTVGDLAGPMFFAAMMGLSRTFYGKLGKRIDLDRFMLGSAVLCAVSYLVIALVPNRVVSLAACGVTGLSVGILWPGTFSKAAAVLRSGGTALFAFLALAGDLGCAGGPTLVGLASSRFGDDLKIGIGAAVVFPLLLIAGVAREKRLRQQ